MHPKITVHIHRFHGLDLVLHWTMDDLHSWTVSTFLFFYFTILIGYRISPLVCRRLLESLHSVYHIPRQLSL